MYSLRRRQHRHYLGYMLAVVGAALIVVGVFYARSLTSDTKLKQSKPLTYYVPATTPPTAKVEEPLFTVELPTQWVNAPAPNTPYTAYSWRGADKSDDNARRLDIYIDTVPLSFAANRLTPVAVVDNHLQTTGPTSDNCSNFTDRSTMAQTGVAPSKWSGVNFLCDLSNYERNVVVAGSTEGVNTITLTGTTTGTHRVLLVYTDNSASPNFAIFAAIIQSFSLR